MSSCSYKANKTSINILRFPETNLSTLSTKTYATDSMASMEALDILNTKCGVLQEKHNCPVIYMSDTDDIKDIDV